MNDLHDLELVVGSHVPIVVIESFEEPRVIDLFKRLRADMGKPVYTWAVTEGLRRLEAGFSPQRHNAEPADVLRQIKQTAQSGIYLLLDFHPYLDEPLNVRLLKEIAMQYEALGHTLVLISHAVEVPPELKRFSARFEVSVPDKEMLERIIRDEALKYSQRHGGRRVKTDSATLQLLVQNLSGLTLHNARRLAHKAIFNDGAITPRDVSEVGRAKYELLGMDGLLRFEYDTAQFSDVGGLEGLKEWLARREVAFRDGMDAVDRPKGILLLGVQGSGKSLAAKAVAGSWGVPLLHLDFGGLYNKFFGETERNLRHALSLAEAMVPCVLWVDEIEKGLGTDAHDTGTSRRVLGTLLTWMAERNRGAFIVATANDVSALPPELMRKGRLDEIFFVDLPGAAARRVIFEFEPRAQSAGQRCQEGRTQRTRVHHRPWSAGARAVEHRGVPQAHR
jgi:hypothetical protein